jgi:hypothetical protein
VPAIVGPRWMINWRGLFANFLPEDVSDQTGLFVTTVFSILTVGVLPLVWRGKWDPRSGRFAVQMLATTIVMMLASFHNHIHSAALLLIPGIAVAAQKEKPRYLGAILVTGLYAPSVLYFVRASMMSVAWLFIALMLAALGIIVHAELAPMFGGRTTQPDRDTPDRPATPTVAPAEPAAI